MKKTSRREFMTHAAVGAGAVWAANSMPAWGRAAQGQVQVAITPQLSTFGYAQVQLLDSPFRRQFDQNHDLYLHLNEDAMLKPFRKREGLPADGPDMGGWYDDADDFSAMDNFHAFIPGHSFGQYLSGLARAYAITGDKATQEKIDRLVRGYGAAVDPAGKFYVDYRLPAYTFDKTCCGLIDAHEFAGNKDALDVLKRSTDAVLPHLPEKALSRPEQRARPHKDIAYTFDETYTLPENFFLAYRRSGDPRYKDLAVRFIEKEYFDPLAENQNVLPGEHAYSHVNALSSAMQSYLVLGDEKYLRAATNGFRMIQEQSFVTGGWGPNEAFVVPGSDELNQSLGLTHASFETPCGAYGHFKITRYLLRQTADSRYGDSMERVLYNTIGGAWPILPDGTSFYYSDYNNAGVKVHYKDKWPCCSGTFPQLAADYGISSYLQGKDGVYVNLFLPSVLSWTQNGTPAKLTQTTQYPRANTTQMVLQLAKPETFTTYVRIPGWTTPKTVVSVNGSKISQDVVPGKFLAVQRTWKDGDRIEVEFDMPMALEPIDTKTPGTVALLTGPTVLFAVNNPPDSITRKQLLAAAPLSQTSSDWIVKTDTRPVTMRPFSAIMNEEYRLYLQVNG
jgi:uncharacterized protein